MMTKILILLVAALTPFINAFAPIYIQSVESNTRIRPTVRWMSDQPTGEAVKVENEDEDDDSDDPMGAAEAELLEKIKRSDDLRSQEVFMKRSTGRFKCKTCDWEFDETKGDIMLIGGTIQPGTMFETLPSNWRCPTCRTSKDNFLEVVEEIPGFAVNQGYGFFNGMTTEAKNKTIFGGLFVCFVLLIGGYGLS